MPQCVFVSVDLPCEFCRSRNIPQPCIKLWGPKTESRLVPSRPIMPYDSDITQEECHLLLCIYTEVAHSSDAKFLSAFVCLFGPSINHRPLRHAIIGVYHTVAKEHIGYAYDALLRNLREPSKVDEGDLFTAQFLALIDFRVNFNEHVNRVLSIMRYLAGRVAKSPLWFVFRDILTIDWLITAEWRRRRSSTSFASMLYLNEILGPPTCQQHEFTLEITGSKPYRQAFLDPDWTGDGLLLALAKMEMLPELASTVNALNEYLRFESRGIRPLDFEQELENLNQTFRSWVDSAEWTNPVFGHLFHGYYILQRSVILEAPSIRAGLLSPKMMAISSSLIETLHIAIEAISRRPPARSLPSDNLRAQTRYLE